MFAQAFNSLIQAGTALYSVQGLVIKGCTGSINVTICSSEIIHSLKYPYLNLYLYVQENKYSRKHEVFFKLLYMLIILWCFSHDTFCIGNLKHTDRQTNRLTMLD